MKRFVVSLYILVLALCAVVEAQEQRFTINDLLKVRRVGDPQVSPKAILSRTRLPISTRPRITV